MLNLNEWLHQIGVQGQNPFAIKQADQEGDDLQAYFVEHPSYNAILDDRFPHNTILHAPRGAGKSSSRRMFEQYCKDHADTLRPLVVELTDWRAIVDRAGSIEQLRPEQCIERILAQALRALANDQPHKWLQQPDDSDILGYLNWLCLAYDQELMPKQRQTLRMRGWLEKLDLDILSDYHLLRLSPAQTLTTLSDVLQSIGYKVCYIVIDRVDELDETASDWEAGAQLLKPLIGNLRLIEIPGLAFKYFIPSEIVAELRRLGSLRDDRIGCFEIQWSGTDGRHLLQNLLENRLRHFSNGRIHTLAQLAPPDFRDVDEQLVLAAQGSLQRLLKLGEMLLYECARTADDDNLLIQRIHLEAACRTLGRRSLLDQTLETDLSSNPAKELEGLVDPGVPHQADSSSMQNQLLAHPDQASEVDHASITKHLGTPAPATHILNRAPSLISAQQEIHHSCFISFATSDQECAETLLASLESNGVKCWYAPDDMVIGTPILRGLSEAIQRYSKLLIILSEASVKSPWVEFEVLQAQQREIQESREILFPIRLDDAVMYAQIGWASDLRARHIGDFRGWKDHNTYQRAFIRLLSNLTKKD